MTPSEAASALGLSPPAIWKAIARGTLEATRTYILTDEGLTGKGGWRIEPDAIDRYRRVHLGRRGPITDRCFGCGHQAHEGERCAQCGDEYTPDPRLARV